MPSYKFFLSFICNLLVLLASSKTLADTAAEQAAMVVTDEWLTHEIAERLRDNYHDLDGDMVVSLARRKPNIELPKGELSLELSSLPSGGLRSRVLLHYNLTLNDKIVHSDTVPVIVKVLREVFVAHISLYRSFGL